MDGAAEGSTGDECHMAFHFPLMPRMYMAIAQEDRFPITDILRQTPSIPANCQWAIFLRNHDELTLEMVTDAERDYLWNHYAADRRARLNLGIRRRLAPLVERDRRRIELLHSLLLSMPGTPTLYYGDELGMGDNIHLGDRDGVRTPMQWSVDRNGGFSRADPASLVLPPILDSLYGYQTINVEAQARDPHSLLNWMRRMLGVRKQQKAFGRGSLSMLAPPNRRILAYLREYRPEGEGAGEESILCVANLSRAAQAVELDLVGLAGRVPVEMLGGSSFPPIGELTYLLTLPPYGFYWFYLADATQMPSWHVAAVERLPELPTLVAKQRLGGDRCSGAPREHPGGRLAAGLPAEAPLVRQGAAGGRQRPSALRHAAGRGRCRTNAGGSGSQWRGRRRALPIAAGRRVGEGRPARQRPAPVAGPGAPAPWAQGRPADRRLQPCRRSPVWSSRNCCARPRRCRAHGDGEIQFIPAAGLAEMDDIADEDVLPFSVEQSNSSIRFGERMVLKVLRKILPGLHPEIEVGGYLTRHGYPGIAPLLGEVRRIGAVGQPHTLMILQGYLNNQGDAWNWTLDHLERAMRDGLSPAVETPGPEFDVMEELRLFAGRLGQRLGEMHQLLAEATDEPEFGLHRSGAVDSGAWSNSIGAQLEQALETLRHARASLGEQGGAMADWLLEQRGELLQAIGNLARLAEGGVLIRVHGDLHLGQVLMVQGDARFIDFEGEPTRPLDERRQRHSPMKDVAGVLRSFDYAAAMALRNAQSTDSSAPAEVQAARAELALRYRREARDAFLAAYRAAAAGLMHAWHGREGEGAALALACLEKAAYELLYEADYRPDWLEVPLAGLAELTEHLLKGKNR